MDIPCWKVRQRGLPPKRQLPAQLTVAEGEPGVLYYPNWAIVAAVSFKTPLTGATVRYIPICVDALTDRMAVLPGPPPIEKRDVPEQAVLEPKVELTEERLAVLRESLMPFVIRRLRLVATPTIEAKVLGLAYKELLVYEATLDGTPCRLFVDTLSGEWTVRPGKEGGAVVTDAPPQTA